MDKVDRFLGCWALLLLLPSPPHPADHNPCIGGSGHLLKSKGLCEGQRGDGGQVGQGGPIHWSHFSAKLRPLRLNLQVQMTLNSNLQVNGCGWRDLEAQCQVRTLRFSYAGCVPVCRDWIWARQREERGDLGISSGGEMEGVMGFSKEAVKDARWLDGRAE